MIENHTKQQERQRLDDSQSDPREEQEEKGEGEEGHEEEEEKGEEEEEQRGEEREEEEEEAAFEAHSDGRLMKSQSEAPIGSPRGQLHLSVTLFVFFFLPNSLLQLQIKH